MAIKADASWKNPGLKTGSFSNVSGSASRRDSCVLLTRPLCKLEVPKGVGHEEVPGAVFVDSSRDCIMENVVPRLTASIAIQRKDIYLSLAMVGNSWLCVLTVFCCFTERSWFLDAPLSCCCCCSFQFRPEHDWTAPSSGFYSDHCRVARRS